MNVWETLVYWRGHETVLAPFLFLKPSLSFNIMTIWSPMTLFAELPRWHFTLRHTPGLRSFNAATIRSAGPFPQPHFHFSKPVLYHFLAIPQMPQAPLTSHSYIQLSHTALQSADLPTPTRSHLFPFPYISPAAALCFIELRFSLCNSPCLLLKVAWRFSA